MLFLNWLAAGIINSHSWQSILNSRTQMHSKRLRLAKKFSNQHYKWKYLKNNINIICIFHWVSNVFLSQHSSTKFYSISLHSFLQQYSIVKQIAERKILYNMKVLVNQWSYILSPIESDFGLNKTRHYKCIDTVDY